MDKHPITPGPVRELHAGMLLLEGRADEALRAYQASLERTLDHQNALAGVEEARAEL